MKICVIPARGGSKRIPRKNIKDFNGKPAIAYPIQAALDSELFDTVLVSTDDEEIMQIAKQYGAQVPFVRPEHLANDTAATAPVLIHAIEWFEAQGETVTEMTCIYPANPFISSALLQEAYQNWNQEKFAYCFGVCEFESAPQRALFQESTGGVNAFQPEYTLTRTQDLVPAFYDAGMFYFCDAQVYKTGESMHGPKAQPYYLPRHIVHDIDTPADWDFAQKMYALVHQMPLHPESSIKKD